eukprot:7887166-Pyramimonas_sp.AAC.1
MKFLASRTTQDGVRELKVVNKQGNHTIHVARRIVASVASVPLSVQSIRVNGLDPVGSYESLPCCVSVKRIKLV